MLNQTSTAHWWEIGKYKIRISESTIRFDKILGLSEREMEFLALMCRGRSVKQCARDMGISPNTVDTYKRRVYEKLGVNTAAEACSIITALIAGAAITPAQEDDMLPAAAA
jgi:DNA-binding CsgD family transcriptional regulator